jgi:hypothetical protein
MPQAGERDQRDPGLRRGGGRMPAHLRGEGMGRIDQMGDAVVANIAHQPVDPAEPADPGRDRLRFGVGHPAGIAQHRRIAARGEQRRERARFGRAAEDEDGRHG